MSAEEAANLVVASLERVDLTLQAELWQLDLCRREAAAFDLLSPRARLAASFAGSLT